MRVEFHKKGYGVGGYYKIAYLCGRFADVFTKMQGMDFIQKTVCLLLGSIVLPMSLYANAVENAHAVSDRSVKSSVYRGFSGGMMLHLGYLYGGVSSGDGQWGVSRTMSGGTMGIGGAARVHLWGHLRVGGEGFVSSMPVGMSNYAGVLQSGSYVRNSWGGVLADAYWQCGKVWPFVGGTIGGGAQRSLYIIDGSQDDWQEEGSVVFNKQTYFMLDPFVGFEVLLTSHIHLTFRVDYVLPIVRTGLLDPCGVRGYVGFMFCR